MSNWLYKITALLCGVLFGVGLVISGMANPAKVIGFLDVAGQWDPSLMFVMGGALLVFMPGYFFIIKPRVKPLNGDEFCLTTKQTVDWRLITGAAVFGLGWGIAGICPGPVVASLGLGNLGAWLFFVCLMLGLALPNLFVASASKA
ncbi:YeeE/YedE family protein [Vibrio sp. AK197]